MSDMRKAGRVLIRGGTLVDPERSPSLFAADLLVEDGRIAALAPDMLGLWPPGVKKGGPRLNFLPVDERDPVHALLGDASAASGDGLDILDARACYVLPGGIDPHTHFELEAGGERVADGFYAGSLAALHGGNTCIVEHPGFVPAGSDLARHMEEYRKLALGRSFVDYGLHLVFQPPFPSPGGEGGDARARFRRVLDSLPGMARQGYASGKAYTTYDGKLDDAQLLELMAAMKEARCLLTAHCESDAIPAWLRAHNPFPASDPRAHPASRPPQCESEAVTRLLALAATVKAPLYVAHVSTAGAMRAIREARDRGQVVYAETCPHYLLLTGERYGDKEGLAYVMTPPLREEEDCRALWRALESGEIDVLATDHCAYSLAQKSARGGGDVFASPCGIPGVETRLPLLFTHGVLSGRIGLERFVELTALNPARIFGLPDKGRLAPGKDADLLVLDPDKCRKLDAGDLHQKVDYCPFSATGAGQGRGLARGWPRHVLLRGQVVLRDGEAVDAPPAGQYVRRAS